MRLNTSILDGDDNGITAIEEFMQSYPTEQGSYRQAAENCAKTCEVALAKAGVQHGLTYRIKSSERLRAKLNAREKRRDYPYRNMDEIKDDIVDFAGVRITVFFPSDKQRVGEIIQQNFDIQDTKALDGMEDRDVVQEGYSPTFPGYCADHYRITLKPTEDNSLHLRRIEIQVMTILRHTWAEVEHDRIYKKLFPTTDEDHQLLDGLSGAIAIGENYLDLLNKRLIAQTRANNKPLGTKWELGLFLDNWAKEKGRIQEVGDVESLWELVQTMELRKPKVLQEILDSLDFSLNPRGEYSRLTSQYAPLRLSLATYMMDRIIYQAGQGRIEERYKKEVGARRQKYKLEVIVNTFIGLSQLPLPRRDWVGMLFPSVDRATEQARKAEIVWLDKRTTKDFYDGTRSPSEEDRLLLEGLWTFFQNNSRLPIQQVFHLAQLGVLKNRPGDWTALHNAISPFLE